MINTEHNSVYKRTEFQYFICNSIRILPEHSFLQVRPDSWFLMSFLIIIFTRFIIITGHARS